jgi:hypothetical protein
MMSAMADVPTEHPPPGWHQDPTTPGRLRWWDGATWTADVAADPSAGARRYPTHQLADAAHWCGHAAKAMWASAAVVATQAVIIAVTVSSIADESGDSTEVGGTDRAAEAELVLLGSSLNLVGLISTAALIVLAVWTYKSTTAMRSFGHRTTHSPGWTAAGWLVPVVSLWFPYQSVRDLVPLHHPARRTVGWWWACWLLGPFACLATGVAALASRPVALPVAIVAAAVAALAAWLGAGLTRATGDELRRMDTVTGR